MAESGLLFRSLSDIAEQIRRQEVSPVEVTRAVLDRLEYLNPRLNAVLTNLGEQALEAAKLAEQDLVAGQPRGPLHGVPLALKDIFALRGVQVTAGSKVLGTWIADYDATVVARLKAAGAIFVATLNLYEFATGAMLNPHYGPTHNPWHLDHTTGGSSTGSGAAVAAGIVYGSLGTDTGGSVRIPASSVRPGGIETDIRPCQSPWCRAALLVAGPCRTTHPHSARHGPADVGHRRS